MSYSSLRAFLLQSAGNANSFGKQKGVPVQHLHNFRPFPMEFDYSFGNVQEGLLIDLLLTDDVHFANHCISEED